MEAAAEAGLGVVASTFGPHLPAVCFNNAMDDKEAKSQPTPHKRGGATGVLKHIFQHVELAKDSLLILNIDPDTAILDHDFETCIDRFAPHVDRSPIRGVNLTALLSRFQKTCLS